MAGEHMLWQSLEQKFHVGGLSPANVKEGIK